MFHKLWMCVLFLLIQTTVADKRKDKRPTSPDDGVEHTWSGWSRWAPCSVTCGRGLQERYRECIGVVQGRAVRLKNPTCSGHRLHYKTCNIKECHPGAGDRRTYQCVQKNNQAVHGEKYKWAPFYGGTNPCELTCMAHGYAFFYNFGPVTDGTPCKRDSDPEEDICVKGHCTRIGCDGHVGSNAVLDHCHKCNGHDLGCVLHKNVYSRARPPKGDADYTLIVKVPKGSHYLRVDDTSKNYLAVADSKMNYIFNGGWVIDWPGTYQMATTTIVYERSFDGNETISAAGPTGEDLHIMLMFRQKNPGISYGFRVQEEKVDLIEEAEKGKASWVTTRVYERYQSHQPEYNGAVTQLPQVNRDDLRKSVQNKTKTRRNTISRQRSNKEKLERSTFHKDIFSGNDGIDQIPEKAVDIDGIQNEASVQIHRRSRSRSKTAENTHKGRQSLQKSTNKKTNKNNSNKDKCTACRKANDKLKQYCDSDFVIRAVMSDYVFVGNDTRYEVRVLQAYKDNIKLLTREYIWTTGTRCRCPKLKINKEYFIVGKLITNSVSRETRLQIDGQSFTRLFNKSNSKRLNSIKSSANC